MPFFMGCLRSFSSAAWSARCFNAEEAYDALSAGDYSLSIIDFQRLWYDSLQAALRLADQIGRAYHLCDDSPWDPDTLTVTWGNGVLYDADKEWTNRKEMVQMGLLKPELALAWKFDLPSETEADLEAVRKKYMPELADLER